MGWFKLIINLEIDTKVKNNKWNIIILEKNKCIENKKDIFTNNRKTGKTDIKGLIILQKDGLYK